MQTCSRCVLTESFPGIKYDGTGVCNYCNHLRKQESKASHKKKFKDKFEKLILQYKGNGTYDCLVAFSGGKDSTHTINVMKNGYGLDVLAFSFNNWFQSHTAIKNVHRVIEKTEVDHVTFLPNFKDFREIILASVSEDLYSSKALERATSICTTCLALIRFSCLKIAIEKNIPLVIFGMSPGQAPIATSIFKTNPKILRMMQNTVITPLQKYLGDKVNKYFLEEKHFEKNDNFPYIINPLAFIDYDEGAIYQSILTLGWQSPQDTDPNSTNCLLNGFANQVHLEKHGFHPYAMELAEHVREGILSRDEALKRLSEEPDPEIIEKVKARLGITE